MQSNRLFLDYKQLKNLLDTPDLSNPIGVRNRAILEMLLFVGLKMNQLIALDKSQIDNHNIYFPKRVKYWLNKYLETRNDNHKALFINYAKHRNNNYRLGSRSIQRTIKKNISDNNLSPSLTAETLRNTYISYLLNKNIKINKISPHGVLIFINYKISNISFIKNNSPIPKWHIAEKIINQEISWLKEKILIVPKKYRNDRIEYCDDCLFRKLAILIASGKVKAIELKAKDGKNLWNHKKENFYIENKHGKIWHRKTMDLVSSYFKKQKYQVILEPTLSFGRADLAIYPSSEKTIYIEIGTVSLFKIWYNLSTMKNITLLLIPSKEYAIEFRT